MECKATFFVISLFDNISLGEKVMASGNKLFGKRIRELREKNNLTQEKLAEILDLDYQTISRIETGYYFTSYENLEKFAKAFKVEIKDLFSTKHLEDELDVEKDVIKMLKKATEEEKKLIYKIVSSIIN